MASEFRSPHAHIVDTVCPHSARKGYITRANIYVKENLMTLVMNVLADAAVGSGDVA